MGSDITFNQLPMPPEDLRELYEQAAGDDMRLMKLIHIEHTRKQGQDAIEVEAQDYLARLGLVSDVADMNPRGLSAGALAAIEALEVDLFSDTKKKGKQTPFSDMCLIAYITQVDPREWVGMIGDKATLLQEAMVWATQVSLQDIERVCQSIVDQVCALDTSTEPDPKKDVAASRGSSRIKRR